MNRDTLKPVLALVLVLLLVSGGSATSNYTANSATINEGSESSNSVTATQNNDGTLWEIDEEDVSGLISNDDDLNVTVGFDPESETKDITKIKFYIEASENGENFNWFALNQESGKYVNTTEIINGNSLQFYTFSVCESGCDLSASPTKFIDNSGNMRTKFNDTTEDGTLHTLSIDYQVIEVKTDDTPPKWRNQAQNSSFFLKSSTANLEAEGFDNYNLSSAVLATNESGGSFENKSSYGSPRTNIFSEDTWELTAFEWKNTSIEKKRTVGWRIWYNDTSGNWNVTDTDEFVVRPNIWTNETDKTSVSVVKSDPAPRGFNSTRRLSQSINMERLKSNQAGMLGRTFSVDFSATDLSPRSTMKFESLAESFSSSINLPRGFIGSRNIVTGLSFADSTLRFSDISRYLTSSINVNDNQIRRSIDVDRALATGVSAVDTASRLVVSDRLETESFNAADTVSRSQVGLRVTAETLTASTAAARTIGSGRSVAASLGLTDSTSQDSVLGRLVGTMVSADDERFRSVDSSRIVIETVSLGLQPSSSFVGGRLLDQSLDVGESISRSSDIGRVFEPVISAADTSFRTTSPARSIAASLSFSLGTSRSVDSARNIAESFSTSDSSSRFADAGRIVLTSFTAADSTSPLQLLGRTNTESFSAVSDTSWSFTGFRQLEEGLGFSDSGSRLADSSRLLGVTAAFSSSATSSFAGSRIVESAFDLTDVGSQDSVLARAFNQPVDISSTLVRSSYQPSRVIYEYPGIQESLDSGFQGSRVETLTTSFLVDSLRSVKGSRNQEENIDTGILAGSSSDLGRTLVTGLTSADTVYPSADVARIIQQTVSVDTTSDGFGFVERIQTESLNYGSVTEPGFTGQRTVISSLTASSSTLRSGINLRLISEIFSGTSSSTRENDAARVTSLSISGAESISTEFLGSRAVDYALTSSFSASRTGLDTGRLVSDSLNTVFLTDRGGSISRIIGSSIGLSDSNLQTSAVVRTFGDSFQLSSSLVRSSSSLRDVSESVNFQGAAQRLLDASRTDSLTAAFSSDTSASSLNIRDVMEDLGYTGAGQSSFTGYRAVSSAVVTTSQVSTSLNPVRTLTEAFSYTSSLDRGSIAGRLVELDTFIADRSARQVDGLRVTSEQVLTGMSVSRSSGLGRIVSPSLGFSSAIDRGVVSSRLFDTGVSLGQSFDGQPVVTRSTAEVFSFTDTTGSSLSLGRTMATSVLYTSELSRGVIGVRTISSSFQLSETSFGARFFSKLVEQSIEYSGSIKTGQDIVRTLVSSFNIPDSVTRSIASSRVESVSAGFSSAEFRQVTGARTLTGVFSLATTSTSTFDLSRLMQEDISLIENSARTLDSDRTLSQGISLLAGTGRTGSTGRVVTGSFSYETSIETAELLRRLVETGTLFTAAGERSLDSSVALSQSIEAADKAISQSSVGRITASSFSIGASITSQPGFFRALGLTVVTGLDTGEAQDLGRDVSQGIPYSDNSYPLQSVSRLVAQSLDASLDEFTESRIERITSMDLGFGSTESTQGISLRTVTDTYTSSAPVFSPDRYMLRTINTVFNAETFQDSDPSVYRSIDTLLSLGEETSTASVLDRILGSELEFTGDTVRESSSLRSITGAFSYSSGATGARIFFGSVADTITATDSIAEMQKFTRKLTPDFGFQDDRSRTVQVLRVVMPGFGFGDVLDGFIPGEDTSDDSDDSTTGSSSDDSSGGSGGGGGGGFPGLGGSSELAFSDDGLTLKLSPGDSASANFLISNEGSADADTELEVRKLNKETIDAISLKKTSYSIKSGSAAEAGIDVKVPAFLGNDNISDRVLEREIQASAGDSDATLPVNILVRSDQEELLDVKLDLKESTVTTGDTASYSFEIFNLGQTGRVDIELFTTVTNSTGHVVHEQKEEFAVQTSASLSRELDADLPPGRYQIKVRAKYADRDASSYSTIKIEEEPDHTLRNILVALLIIGLMAGSAVVSVLFYQRRNVDYQKLTQKTISDIKTYTRNHPIDFEKLLEEEKRHKDRKTLEEWAARKAGMEEDEQDKPVKVKDSGDSREESREESSKPEHIEVQDKESGDHREGHKSRTAEEADEEAQETDEEPETFTCEECGREFDTEQGLYGHKGQAHKEEEKEEEDQEPDNFKCEECGREFDTKRGLSSHKVQKHREEEDNEEEDPAETGEDEDSDDGAYEGVKKEVEELESKIDKIEDIKDDIENTLED